MKAKYISNEDLFGRQKRFHVLTGNNSTFDRYFHFKYAFQELSPGGSREWHIYLITYNYLYEQITGNV
jgi:hypothetical protein